MKSHFSPARYGELLYLKLLSEMSDKYTAAGSQYQSCGSVAKIHYQESQSRKMKNIPNGRSISRLSRLSGNFNGEDNFEGKPEGLAS